MILILCFLLLPATSFGWNSPENFESSFIHLEEGLNADTIRTSFKSAKGKLSSQIVDTILNDKKNIIHDDFMIPEYFKNSVYFWFSIYSQFTDKQVVIHDMEDLDIIYNVIDFREIFNSNLNKFAKANLKSRLSRDYARKLKKILRELSVADFTKLNAEQYDVLQSIQKSKTKIPKSKKRKKLFFKTLIKNIRTQSGQRNRIYQGIIRSTPFLPFINSKVDLFKLPNEILAIPFLESSFNPDAISKVDAVGIWQFMKYTNNLFMPKKSKTIDYRKNPFISSVAALHLLKENRLILRRWDMAITAYNSGTSNLVKARKKFKRVKNLDLAYVLDHYKSNSLGFASKNFYSEFLALVHALAYKEIIYPLKGLEKHMKELDTKINIYVSKCTLKPNSLYKLLKKSSPHIEELNQHFLKPKKSYPKGSLVVSDVDLTARRYLKLTNEQITAKFPKKYHQYVKSKKCNKI